MIAERQVQSVVMAGTRDTCVWHVARECGGGVTLVCTCVLTAELTTDIIIPAAGADLRILHYCCCIQSAGCILTLTAVLHGADNSRYSLVSAKLDTSRHTFNLHRERS